MKLTFGDIVIVEGDKIGVIVKSWITQLSPVNSKREKVNHEVYVRIYNSVREYPETKIERYLVRHKELSEEELEYQYNAMNNL